MMRNVLAALLSLIMGASLTSANSIDNSSASASLSSLITSKLDGNSGACNLSKSSCSRTRTLTITNLTKSAAITRPSISAALTTVYETIYGCQHRVSGGKSLSFEVTESRKTVTRCFKHTISSKFSLPSIQRTMKPCRTVTIDDESGSEETSTSSTSTESSSSTSTSTEESESATETSSTTSSTEEEESTTSTSTESEETTTEE